MSDPLLRVHLEAGYGRQPVVEEIRFELGKGEALGLTGASGAGKSTLILAIMGLLSWRNGWARGEVLFEGRNLLGMKQREARRVLGNRLALVPQSPTSALNSAVSLRTHFEEAWRAHETGPACELRLRLDRLLSRLHLPSDQSFLARRPGQISVGQAQRVVLALALLHRPALVIADEPTSALDPGNRIEILDLLRQANHEDGTALLFISHDLISVLQLCHRMAVLHGGCIVESLPVLDMEAQATHPATLELLRSLPAPAEVLCRYSKVQVPVEG